jgi:hypothetical protein
MRSRCDGLKLEGRVRTGAGCRCFRDLDAPLLGLEDLCTAFTVSLDACNGLAAPTARLGLLSAALLFIGLGEGIRDVSSSKLSVKNSSFGTRLAWPKTDPLARVCEGSGLFSLLLDMAMMVALEVTVFCACYRFWRLIEG